MSEQLDNELRDRINEVFEQYEDTTPAQDGWLLLREKFPVKKKRPVLAVWWSAAAVLLLLSVLGTWVYTQSSKTKLVAVKPVDKSLKFTRPERKSQLDSVNAGPDGNRFNNNAPVNEEQYAIHTGITATRPIAPSGKLPDENIYPDIVKTTQPLAANTTLDGGVIAQSPKYPVTVADSSQQAATSKTAQQGVLAQQTTKSQQRVTGGVDSAGTTGQSKMSIYLANEQKNETVQKQNKEKKPAVDKKVLYSVYAATYFNYAQGSKSQINTGAGFGTDIKLAGNFKLSTGIAIGRNTLNYNSQPTQANLAMDATRAASASSSANDMVQSSPTTTFGFSSLRVLASPVVSAYNISLTGLDLPVNIKYEFNPRKSDSYISAGLSSGTFISETYNYSYDNSVNALGASPSLPDASVSRSFTRFDFARTLNVSLGMGYQITKGNRLIIEPFLKYPLSGMGSQDIRFGSGGINLRLKFQGGGKKQ